MSEKKALKKNRLLKRNRLPRVDVPFLLVIFALLFVGLAMLFSAGYASAFLKQDGNSYYFIKKQLIFAALGLMGMAIISFISYKFYRRFAWLFYGVCVLLLIVVLIVGKGSQKRWLYIGGFQFQPSEFAKVAVVMMLADYISRNRDKMKKFVPGIVLPCCIWGLPCFLVLIETHLSGAILIAAIGVIMMIVGGCRILYIAAPGGALAVAAVIAVTQIDYMKQRVLTWLHPENDLLGDGWQAYQSMTSIGSGGLFGLGFGKSRQKYLYMSEPQNDFIFSITCEELGFVGAVIIIGLFAYFIYRGLHIANNAPNTFTALMVAGIIGKISVQVIFNIAVVTGSVPVTGIPLPFFSYGGTALFVLLCEMGLVLYISRFATVEKGSDTGKVKGSPKEVTEEKV